MTRRLTLNWHEHHSSLVSLVQSFWGDDLLVDCTLAAEGKYLKAHRVILSACSPYFQLLFSQENEKNPIVILKDVQFEYLKAVINFVYFGEVRVRVSQLSTFLEVARSLQIKGLDNEKEAAQKSASSTHSKTKGSSSRPLTCKDSGEVVDDTIDCKVVSVVNRIARASSLDVRQCHTPSPSLVEGARNITIESSYSIAPSDRSTPELDDRSNSGALEHPSVSAPSSVVLRVPDSSGAVRLRKVQETNNLKPDPDENSSVRENTSTEIASGSGNNRRRSSDSHTSGSEEGANDDGVTPGPSDDDNSSGRRKPRSSKVLAKRSVLSLSRHALKSPMLRLSRVEGPAKPGSVTTSVKTKEATHDSSTETEESSKKEESTAPESPKTDEALSRVLTKVLPKTKIRDSALVPNKEPPATDCSLITYSGPNAKRQRRYIKKHTCPDCNKQFLRPSYLIVHRRRHTGERPHICPICNKNFAQPGALKRHISAHSGERPYTCGFCQKSFNRSSTLEVHERLHTGERPYKCPVCGKTFIGQSQLWSHKRVHVAGNYECDACGEAFKRKPLLIHHWYLVHEKGEVIHSVKKQ